jgi:hypothetical protein
MKNNQTHKFLLSFIGISLISFFIFLIFSPVTDLLFVYGEGIIICAFTILLLESIFNFLDIIIFYMRSNEFLEFVFECISFIKNIITRTVLN